MGGGGNTDQSPVSVLAGPEPDAPPSLSLPGPVLCLDGALALTDAIAKNPTLSTLSVRATGLTSPALEDVCRQIRWVWDNRNPMGLYF